ncbi:Protein kinase domain-containing protein ppk32 [Coemansia asiatica]|uniref:Protein kinase domain-containing protein ppk32 n=1 Tax=Coemansia asiatica TaxID=1052880 RepID=A0A9W7XP43_9FUNG|nr:Protein kinase domain-containing protein ppk32 [Coemansia asiatica]
MDGYLSKLRGLASSAANAVQSKIGRDYEADFSSRPQGHSGLWTLYKSSRRATGQAATIWVFEKQKFFERGINRQVLGPREQTQVLELLKNEAAQLTRLRHPSVLQVMEPLEDTRSSLMFVTEQVIASMEDLINSTGSSSSSSRWVVEGEEYELDELEIQKGLLQVSRGLQFLHRDARIMHANLRPSSVLVDAKGDWKLAGLGFSRPTVSGSRAFSFEHDYGMPDHTQQALAFMAPEMVNDGHSSGTCDAFSLGCLAFALHNRGASPLNCGNDIGAYNRSLASIQQQNSLSGLPEALAPVVSSLLSRDPGNRMTLDEFQKSAYFDNVLVASLRYLEAFAAQPKDQKIAFMQGLLRILPQYPVRVLRRKLLPALLDQANDHDLLRFTLPNIFHIVEHLTPAEFASLAVSGLQSIFTLTGLSAQTTVVLLENVTLMQKKMAEPMFNKCVMPLVYQSLVSADSQVQDQALKAVPEISKHLGYADLKDQLLPRVQQLYSRATILAHKVRALMCLHGMLSSLDKSTISEKILPMLKRTKTREPAVVIAMLAMYEEMGFKYLDRVMVAKEIIPELWGILVEARLSLEQFDRLAAFLHKISKKIQDEQRIKTEEYQRIDRQTLSGGDTADGSGGRSPIGGSTGSQLIDGSQGFEALVRGDSPAYDSGSSVMKNPLNSAAAQVANPVVAETKTSNSGWEWDAPAPSLSSLSSNFRTNGSVEADLAASDDLFGSFASVSISSPAVLSPKTNTSTRVATKLRTSSNNATFTNVSLSAHGSGGKLGAMKLGSGNTTTAFGIALPPPPSSTSLSSSSKKPLSTVAAPAVTSSFGGTANNNSRSNQTIAYSNLSFGQSMIQPTVVSSKPRKQTTATAQKHIGGKTADLDDFDPFA